MFVLVIKRFYLPAFYVLALMVYLAQQLMIILPLTVNNYLNDLLCMPIVLKICQYAIRFIRRDKHLNIPVNISLTLTVLYSLYFELLLPLFHSRYTADAIDVVLYFLGLLFFLWIENVPKAKNKDEIDKSITSS
jgi:hypothetical protein